MFMLYASIFLFGLAIGSFLNVVIYRTLHGESPLEGRSRCPHCKTQIRAIDNIPLVSYILLRGKCRKCKKPISVSYPAVELITAILFVWWFLFGSFFFKLAQFPFAVIQPAYWLVVGLILLSIFFADLTYGLIPDVLVFILGACSFIYRLILTSNGIMQTGDFWSAIVSAFTAFLFFYGLVFLTRGKGMGMGDVKLAFSLGLMLGWPRTLVGLFLSFVIGAATSLVLVIFKARTIKQTIPFGPFLVVGTLISLLFGNQIWHHYIYKMLGI
jgi:leader peptidase (prepilin peptidase)/N-methyltransferase